VAFLHSLPASPRAGLKGLVRAARKPVRALIAALVVHAAWPAGVPAAAGGPDGGAFAGVSWGIKGGGGLAQHQGVEPRDSEYAVASAARSGPAVGLFLHLSVTRRFALQQELLYARKGSRQDIGVKIMDIPTTLHVSYDMDYLEIPVLLRYAWLIDAGFDLYSLAGFGFALKVRDRYRLSGLVSDGVESIPLRADSDMSEVDLFDFALAYGVGVEMPLRGLRLLVEYRFDLGLQRLPLPTYAFVPFGDEEFLVDNEPVGLRNQAHMLLLGIRFGEVIR